MRRFPLLFIGLALIFPLATSAADLPEYYVTTVAGLPGVAGFHDGPTSDATFDKPTWLDIIQGPNCSAGEVGEIYVVDRLNNAVRRISGQTVSTFSTSGAPEYLGYPSFDFDGPFGGGILIEPPDSGCGCWIYDRGFYVASTGKHEVPLLSFIGSLASRDYVVIIGNPTRPLREPTGLARSPDYNGAPNLVTGRFLYIADSGGHTIHRVAWGFSIEFCPLPASVDVFAGEVDLPGHADGRGAAARFNTPRGIATAADGSVYVADSGNHTIRRIAVDGTVTTVAGEAGIAGSNDGPALLAHLNTPSGIDVSPAGDVYITDTGNATVRMLTTDGLLVTVAGKPGVSGFADGPVGLARFSGPVGIRIAPDGSILVADTSNHVIRRISVAPKRRRSAR